MKQQLTKNRIIAIVAVAIFAALITLAVLATPRETNIIRDQQTEEAANTPQNPLAPYITGLHALNDNPWGFTGTQVELIRDAITNALITENQARATDKRIIHITLDANSVRQTINTDGSRTYTFTLGYDDKTRHGVAFTITVRGEYTLTLDGVGMTLK